MSSSLTIASKEVIKRGVRRSKEAFKRVKREERRKVALEEIARLEKEANKLHQAIEGGSSDWTTGDSVHERLTTQIFDFDKRSPQIFFTGADTRADFWTSEELSLTEYVPDYLSQRERRVIGHVLEGERRGENPLNYLYLDGREQAMGEGLLAELAAAATPTSTQLEEKLFQAKGMILHTREKKCKYEDARKELKEYLEKDLKPFVAATVNAHQKKLRGEK